MVEKICLSKDHYTQEFIIEKDEDGIIIDLVCGMNDYSCLERYKYANVHRYEDLSTSYFAVQNHIEYCLKHGWKQTR